jgi:hypothetical protein
MNLLLAALCAVAALLLVAAVLSTRVDDGVLGKLGLIAMALALASISVHAATGDGVPWRSIGLLAGGGAVAWRAPFVRAWLSGRGEGGGDRLL